MANSCCTHFWGQLVVNLVEQLEHGSLDLSFSAGVGFVAFRSDGVDLVDEDDGGRVVFGDAEQLTDQLGPVTEVLLDLYQDNPALISLSKPPKLTHIFGYGLTAGLMVLAQW